MLFPSNLRTIYYEESETENKIYDSRKLALKKQGENSIIYEVVLIPNTQVTSTVSLNDKDLLNAKDPFDILYKTVGISGGDPRIAKASLAAKKFL